MESHDTLRDEVLDVFRSWQTAVDQGLVADEQRQLDRMLELIERECAAAIREHDDPDLFATV